MPPAHVWEAASSNHLPYVWINGITLILESDLAAYQKRRRGEP
jgi:hypothetical protein